MSQIWEKSSQSKVCRMSTLIEASQLVRSIGAFPGQSSIKCVIARAARRAGLSFSRAKRLYYADPAAAVRADELERLRRIASVPSVPVNPLIARIEALEMRLAQIDPDFFGDSIKAARDAVHAAGNVAAQPRG